MAKTIYTQELADRICAELATGRSLKSVCEESQFPDKATFYRWMDDEDKPELRDKYARAKQEAADHIAEEILEIADDARNDFMENLDDEGQPIGYKLNGEHVQRSKLRIDSRKWIASKLAPKKYGDRSFLDVEQRATVSNEPMSPEEWEEKHGGE